MQKSSERSRHKAKWRKTPLQKAEKRPDCDTRFLAQGCPNCASELAEKIQNGRSCIPGAAQHEVMRC
jgi:hypothetical protein